MRRHTAAIAVAALVWPSFAFAQPFAQQGSKLVGTGATGAAQQGSAVALSSDGNTAIVGGPADNSAAGAVWIFTRSGSTWTQQGSKLVGTGATGVASQGGAVALSANGNTAVVAGVSDNSNVGAVWIFVRNGSTWTQQGSKLVGTGAIGASFQGKSVAISADGDTVLVGGYADNTFVGAAWVFTRSGGTWTQQGGKLTATGATGSPGFGISVSLSADGDLALMGGSSDNSGAGAAWVFARSGATWTQQGGKLTATGAAGVPQFGSHVALSADGETAAISGHKDNLDMGAVWIFTGSGSTWTQQGSKLVGGGAAGPAVYQGLSASLSSNGNILWEGGYGDATSKGASFEFARDLGAWAQVGTKLVGSGAADGSTGAWQGWSSFLSSDGRTAIVGGWRDDSDHGAVWIFTRVLPAFPQHAAGDFDSDGRIDAPLFKANGDWSFLKSTSGFTSSTTVNWTAPGYVPVRGDFDGDNGQDPALYNPVTGNWLILKSSSNFTASINVNWGGSGYTAVPGDYDGDGKTDPAVYNTSTGAWLILESSSNYTTTTTVNFGGPAFTPIGGQDFDGDYIADIAIYRQSTGVWSVRKSSTAFATAFHVSWGGPGYTLVPADYDGDDRADLGLYDRATGAWQILKSSSGYSTTINVNWGGAGYVPVPGFFDADRLTDLGLYQPSTGNWYVLLGAANYTTTLTITGWGSSTDVPLSPAIVIGGSDLLRAGDYDGDGRSEITVNNLSTGVWSSLTSSSNYTGATNRSWGGSGYAPAPGDFDGDGRTDFATYQFATGNWYVLLSSSNFTTSLSKSVGGSGWLSRPGDYDGDGKTDFVVYNSSTGQWYGLKSSTNYTTSISIFYGGSAYTSVPGDYDGDGRTDIAVYADATGAWSVLLSSTNYTTSMSKSVGGAGYGPVPEDYDGDGKTDFVVYSPSTGLWYGLKSGSNYTTTLSVSWGGSGYMPVKGDYDGDGKADLATYVTSTGNWYILLSGANYTTTITKNWGGSAYIPLPLYPLS